ncbi:hematopoietic cell signal transducer isoform 1-T2 [Clarias gariepinus]|uniref:hematopoietic cell signal transducer n=1 Tax=Clarias gariepinus TaxID=13013 RepID=UPI00234E0293|nr:hematopoietic cell signal transducer [Clarias gariepinus]XP_053349797.1 hematopoietic cell signal transducer [Clarias gariepinus]
MKNQGFPLYLFIVYLAMIRAEKTESGPCYRIAPGMLAGVVLGDIALTILIVAATYYCASKRRIKKEKADKVYMNVRANCKQSGM